MSLEEVASWILKLAQSQPNLARNAFCAFLHIPGWEFSNFSQYMKNARQLWSGSGARYADFWDATNVIYKLRQLPVNLNDIREVRDRTILLLRLFHLCRSIDLAKSLMTKAKGSNQVY